MDTVLPGSIHTWSPMSNSGFLSQSHEYTPHEMIAVRHAKYNDRLRLLTVYQKDFLPLEKRKAKKIQRPDSQQLIASKWQTPRVRETKLLFGSNVEYRAPILEDTKEAAETERILYSGRVPDSLLPSVPQSDQTHYNYGRGYVSKPEPVPLLRYSGGQRKVAKEQWKH